MSEPTSLRSQTAEGKERPFDNILNFRDVGKTINGLLGEKYVLSGHMFNQMLTRLQESCRRQDISECKTW